MRQWLGSNVVKGRLFCTRSGHFNFLKILNLKQKRSHKFLWSSPFSNFNLSFSFWSLADRHLSLYYANDLQIIKMSVCGFRMHETVTKRKLLLNERKSSTKHSFFLDRSRPYYVIIIVGEWRMRFFVIRTGNKHPSSWHVRRKSLSTFLLSLKGDFACLVRFVMIV